MSYHHRGSYNKDDSSSNNRRPPPPASLWKSKGETMSLARACALYRITEKQVIDANIKFEWRLMFGNPYATVKVSDIEELKCKLNRENAERKEQELIDKKIDEELTKFDRKETEESSGQQPLLERSSAAPKDIIDTDDLERKQSNKENIIYKKEQERAIICKNVLNRSEKLLVGRRQQNNNNNGELELKKMELRRAAERVSIKKKIVKKLITIFNVSINPDENIREFHISKAAAKIDWFLKDSDLMMLVSSKCSKGGHFLQYKLMDVIERAVKKFQGHEVLVKKISGTSSDRLSKLSGYLKIRLDNELENYPQDIVDEAKVQARSMLKADLKKSVKEVESAMANLKTNEQRVRAFDRVHFCGQK